MVTGTSSIKVNSFINFFMAKYFELFFASYFLTLNYLLLPEDEDDELREELPELLEPPLELEPLLL